MVCLEYLEEKDFTSVVEWNRDTTADFLYQWAGRGYEFPLTEEKVRQRFLDGANREGSDTFIYRIILRETGEMIGTVELFKIDRTTGEATVGRFLLDSRHRGKGYGQQALKALVDLAFGELGLKKLYLAVFDFNLSAIACYEKVGFRKECFIPDMYQTAEGPWGMYRMALAIEGS